MTPTTRDLTRPGAATDTDVTRDLHWSEPRSWHDPIRDPARVTLEMLALAWRLDGGGVELILEDVA